MHVHRTGDNSLLCSCRCLWRYSVPACGGLPAAAAPVAGSSCGYCCSPRSARQASLCRGQSCSAHASLEHAAKWGLAQQEDSAHSDNVMPACLASM